MEKKNITVAFAVFFISFGFFPLSQPYALAETAGMHAHHDGAGDARGAYATRDEGVIVEHKTEPARIAAGSPTTIVLSLKDRKGKPLQGLSIHHERILHVVIAGQDFSAFAHIHPEDLGPISPEMKKTAGFHVRYTFPKAGRYLIGVDFAVGEQLFSKHFSVDVAGEPQMGSPEKDLSREKRFGDLDVSLASIPERIMAGKEVTLRYLFKRNGEPVDDLEPYLSAPMHLSIISADLDHFIHTHGELPGMSSMGQHGHHMHMAVPPKFGPEIDVHVVFPAKGVYQVFGQVGRQGEVIVTGFMVEVE